MPVTTQKPSKYDLTKLRPGKSKKDYPVGSPTVTFLRGTSGSGKTTIIYNLLLNPAYGFETVMRTNPVTKKSSEYGYVSKSLNCFIVGPYRTAAGGCDLLTSTGDVLNRVFKAASKGYNVLAEGLIMSVLRSKLEEVSARYPLVVYALTTELDTCLDRVKTRRAARGEIRPLNPKNTISKMRSVLSSTHGLADSCVSIHYESNEKAYRRLLYTLGAKDVVPFNPNIYSEVKSKQPAAVQEPRINPAT